MTSEETTDVGPSVTECPVARPTAIRLVYLDFIRGIAILMVLCSHTPAVIRIHPILDSVSDYLHFNGGRGVDLFFVLSGFLIGGLLFTEWNRCGAIDVGRFLMRRAFKIWPAYLICLTCTCVISALMSKDMIGEPHPFQTVFGDMWPAYFHVQNYVPSTERFAYFWSLAVEEHFYLFLPAAIILISRSAGNRVRIFERFGWMTVGIAAICLILRGIARVVNADLDGYTHYFPTHLRIDSLLAGVMLSALVHYRSDVLSKIRSWQWFLAFFTVGICALPAMFPNRKYSDVYPVDCTLVTLGSMSAVLLAHFADLRLAGRQQLRWERLTRWLIESVALIGFFSYSIYLWHGYFAPAISKRMMDAIGLPTDGIGTSALAHLVVYLGVAIGLGMVSYWLIEKPFLTLRDRCFPRR